MQRLEINTNVIYTGDGFTEAVKWWSDYLYSLERNNKKAKESFCLLQTENRLLDVNNFWWIGIRFDEENKVKEICLVINKEEENAKFFAEQIGLNLTEVRDRDSIFI